MSRGYWGEFKILAISQVILFAKRRVYQSGCLQNLLPNCSQDIHLKCRASPKPTFSPQNHPFHFGSQPLQGQVVPLGLILFLHLCIRRDISLMCVPINGQLSTHLSTTLFWRSVTDPMLCDPSWSAHWGAFPSSLHPPQLKTLFPKHSPSDATLWSETFDGFPLPVESSTDQGHRMVSASSPSFSLYAS